MKMCVPCYRSYPTEFFYGVATHIVPVSYMTAPTTVSTPSESEGTRIRYASMGKEGVANRFHPLEELQLPNEIKFCAWWRLSEILLPLEAISPQAALFPTLASVSQLQSEKGALCKIQACFPQCASFPSQTPPHHFISSLSPTINDADALPSAFLSFGLRWKSNLFGPVPAWAATPNIATIEALSRQHLSADDLSVKFLAGGAFNKVYLITVSSNTIKD